jgi:AraC-like DNA-binding protein
VWLPPAVEHQGLNRLQACHASVYVAQRLCSPLPQAPCALTVSPLLRALLEHLGELPATASAAARTRLLQVLVDQLAQAPRAGSWLPGSADPLLAPVLHALEQQPGDPRALAELARAAHTTERTLARRCQRDLGMPFAEWRQRLRVVKALPRLEGGEKVETIALDLGYAGASAFIAMFRRLMGITPDEFRKQRSGAGQAPALRRAAAATAP